MRVLPSAASKPSITVLNWLASSLSLRNRRPALAVVSGVPIVCVLDELGAAAIPMHLVVPQGCCLACVGGHSSAHAPTLFCPDDEVHICLDLPQNVSAAWHNHSS